MREDALLLWSVNGVDLQLSFRAQQPTRFTGRIPKAFLVAGVSEKNIVQSQIEHQAEALAVGLVTGGLACRVPCESPAGDEQPG